MLTKLDEKNSSESIAGDASNHITGARRSAA